MSDGVHKKQRHIPRHVSGRLSSFCCLLTSQTNLHKTILVRTNGVGTRLYDSPARAELYATNNLASRSSSSAAFRAQLTDERDRPLCSNETSDLRQN